MTDPSFPLHDAAPEWFAEALAVPFTDEWVDVAGVPIHYLAWGEPGRRGLVFVHGGGAHAHWWTHVAARFSEEFRVLALDLSGHGDSGHRPHYSLELWTEEVVAVARAVVSTVSRWWSATAWEGSSRSGRPPCTATSSPVPSSATRR